jgi:hypothetical protein
LGSDGVRGHMVRGDGEIGEMGPLAFFLIDIFAFGDGGVHLA